PWPTLASDTSCFPSEFGTTRSRKGTSERASRAFKAGAIFQGNVDISVDLELAPVVNVTDEMRDAVGDAFGRAGLSVNWAPMPGDRSLLESRRRAEPTLRVFVQTDSDSSSL